MHLSEPHSDLMTALLALEHEEGRAAVEEITRTPGAPVLEEIPKLTVVR